MSVDAASFELGDVGGAGPAVLCLHGLTGTPYEVRPPAEALARSDVGFACLGPLLPGHGRTARELAGTPRNAWVEAALAAYDRLARTHCGVYAVGLSMGGVLALRLAARRPLRGAVVMAAPVRLPGWVRALVPLLAPWGPSLPRTPDILDREARARHPGCDRMPLRAVRELIRLGAEVDRELSRVTAPLRLIYSRRDRTVPLSNARWIRGRVASRRCEIRTLSNSGHVLPVDREGTEVARQVVGFLCELEHRAAVDAPERGSLLSTRNVRP